MTDSPAPKPSVRREAKHHELTETLREIVARLQPGDKLPTQEALMRAYSVSDTTVLRALEALKQEGLVVRRQGSGTFVAEPAPKTAASASVPRSRMVAVACRPSSSPFFSDVIHAVEENLQRHNIAPVLIMERDVLRRVERIREYWTRGEVLGAVHIGSSSLPGIGDVPLIMIGETDKGGEHCQVSLDNFGAGRLVGDYLWNMGHRGVAVITIKGGGASDPPPLQGVDRLRVAGIRQLWEERGGVWREEWQIAHPFLLHPEEHRGVEIMRSYLEPIFSSATPPTAVFAAHDEMATVAIRALEEMGLHVPGDVSVVGFNDSGTLAAYFRPSLTTVRTPAATFGTLAVHLLHDLLEEPERKPRSLRLPPDLIVRNSTAPPPQTKL